MENLIGFLLPPIIEVVNKDVKNPDEKFLVAIVSCVIVAVFIHWSDVVNANVHSLPAFFGTLGIIFTESQAVFKLYWNDSLAQEKLQSALGGSKTA